MGDQLIREVDEAVAAMTSGSDEDALRALIVLAAQPPADVLGSLFARLMESEPREPRNRSADDRLPDDETIGRVLELVRDPRTSALLQLGGGTYDGLLALLVATLAAVNESSAEASP